MPQAKKPAPDPLSVEVALTGILALMVDEREARLAEDFKPRKTVSLLRLAGLSIEQIAELTGKNGPAVAKALQRDKAQADKLDRAKGAGA